MPRKQNKNLTPFTSDQSREEAAKNGRKGGIASGKARRQKKTLAHMAQMFAALPVPEKTKRQLTALGVSEEDTIHQMALIAAMFKAGESGNVRAAKLLGEWMEASNGAEEKDGVLSDILDAVKGVDND